MKHFRGGGGASNRSLGTSDVACENVIRSYLAGDWMK
jgi:hypothetical protein